MGKNVQHNPAKDPVKAEDWNESVARLDDPRRILRREGGGPIKPSFSTSARADEPEKIIPIDLVELEFDDFSEYTAGLRHLKDGPISRMRRRSFLSGLMIGLLTSSLIWFIMLIVYGIIVK